MIRFLQSIFLVIKNRIEYSITICLVSGSFLFMGCSTPKMDEIAFGQLKNSTDFSFFLKKFPTSEYAKKVEGMLDSVDRLNWSKIKYSNDVNLLIAYKKGTLNSKLIDEIDSTISSISDLTEWRNAAIIDSIKGYSRFLRNFPTSDYQANALYRIEQLHYLEAMQKQDVSTLQRFLELYPTSDFYNKCSDELIRLQCLADWKSIENSSEPKDFDSFITKYPNSNLIPMAIKKKEAAITYKAELKKDEELWIYATNGNTISTYNYYLTMSNLRKYSDSATYNINQISALNNALNKDWYTDYQDFLKNYPEGRNSYRAKQRLAFLQNNKVNIIAKYPEVIYQSGERYYYSVTISVPLGGNKSSISGSGHYVDNQGTSWGPNGYSFSTPDWVLYPGQSETYSSWYSGDEFKGGYCFMLFTGEDAGGNKISLQVKIYTK